MKTTPLELSGELGKTPSTPEGIPWKAAIWPAKKTFILLPPDGTDRVAQIYIFELIEEIKRQLTDKKPLIKLIPFKWKIYVCHGTRLIKANFESGMFDDLPVERINSKEIRDYVKSKLVQQSPLISR